MDDARKKLAAEYGLMMAHELMHDYCMRAATPSLRDQFAMAALASCSGDAQAAYRIADKMLKERGTE